MSIRILIVDDHPLVRSGLRTTLSEEEDLEIVGEAENGRQAIALVERRVPEVVLMDIEMPEMDGLQATRVLTAPDAAIPVAVLILTTFALDRYVFEALRVGAAGFLLKDVKHELLVQGIRATAQGQGMISPEITGRLITEFAAISPDPNAAQLLEQLTERERDVFLLIAAGKSNSQIATELTLEETTVKTHVSSLLSKLNLKSRVQAVILAYETRLIAPGGMAAHVPG